MITSSFTSIRLFVVKEILLQILLSNKLNGNTLSWYKEKFTRFIYLDPGGKKNWGSQNLCRKDYPSVKIFDKEIKLINNIKFQRFKHS